MNLELFFLRVSDMPFLPQSHFWLFKIKKKIHSAKGFEGIQIRPSPHLVFF